MSEQDVTRYGNWDAPIQEGVIHMATLPVPSELPEPLPLCWLAESGQRGATLDEWALSFDLDNVPGWTGAPIESDINCQDCKELIHS